MWLKMGNPAPVEEWTHPETGETTRREIPLPDDSEDAEQTTEVIFPEGLDLIEAFTNVTHPGGVWAKHADQTPTWVMSDVPELAQLVAANYRKDGKTVPVLDADSEPVAIVGPSYAVPDADAQPDVQADAGTESEAEQAPGVAASVDESGAVQLQQKEG